MAKNTSPPYEKTVSMLRAGIPPGRDRLADYVETLGMDEQHVAASRMASFGFVLLVRQLLDFGLLCRGGAEVPAEWPSNSASPEGGGQPTLGHSLGNDPRSIGDIIWWLTSTEEPASGGTLPAAELNRPVFREPRMCARLFIDGVASMYRLAAIGTMPIGRAALLSQTREVRKILLEENDPAADFPSRGMFAVATAKWLADMQSASRLNRRSLTSFWRQEELSPFRSMFGGSHPIRHEEWAFFCGPVLGAMLFQASRPDRESSSFEGAYEAPWLHGFPTIWVDDFLDEAALSLRHLSGGG